MRKSTATIFARVLSAPIAGYSTGQAFLHGGWLTVVAVLAALVGGWGLGAGHQ